MKETDMNEIIVMVKEINQFGKEIELEDLYQNELIKARDKLKDEIIWISIAAWSVVYLIYIGLYYLIAFLITLLIPTYEIGLITLIFALCTSLILVIRDERYRQRRKTNP